MKDPVNIVLPKQNDIWIERNGELEVAVYKVFRREGKLCVEFVERVMLIVHSNQLDTFLRKFSFTGRVEEAFT